MDKQFIEQLQRVVEAEASRACAGGDDALQLQAPVADGAHAAGHADGAGETGQARTGRDGRRAASASGSVKHSTVVRWARPRVPCPGLCGRRRGGVQLGWARSALVVGQGGATAAGAGAGVVLGLGATEAQGRDCLTSLLAVFSFLVSPHHILQSGKNI